MKLLAFGFLTSVSSILAQSCGTLPTDINWNNHQLPDPFKFLNGTEVKTKDDWACRREEIISLFRRYELGPAPQKPDFLNAKLDGENLNINATLNGRHLLFTVKIEWPSVGLDDKPYPAIILPQARVQPAPASAALLTFNAEELIRTIDYRDGLFYRWYGRNPLITGHSAFVYIVGLILDSLVLIPESELNINLNRIAINSCLRHATPSFFAAALDERIRLTIVQDTTEGGTQCWRLTPRSNIRITIESPPPNNALLPGFDPNWISHNNRFEDLPVDHHLLAGLIAPRPLLVLSATLPGAESTYGCMTAARTIYQSLGAEDVIGLRQENVQYCAVTQDNAEYNRAFTTRYLLDGDSETAGLWNSDGAEQYAKAVRHYWKTPVLE